MKTIFLMLLIAITASASVPLIFGPAGAPPGIITPTWIGDGLTATSTLDMKGDTLAIISTTAGDADIYLNFQEADGSKHLISWDDGRGKWVFDSNLSANQFRLPEDGGILSISGSSVKLSSTASYPTILQDPNNAGSGTLQLGETGDNDITLLQSNLRGAFITSAVQDTIGTAECIYFEQTANEPVYLPPSPTTGDTHRIKFTHALGGTLDGNGNTIDGNATISASEDNAYMVVFNGTEWGVW